MYEHYVESLDGQRIAEVLWELVRIPSPTGQEREAALAFAKMLSSVGLQVEVDETIPESPCVVGRLKGCCRGPVLQLAGHIDHIAVEHPEPIRQADTISGRGCSDMKGGLAGMLEVVRLLATDRDFPGEILVTVYGLHEAPRGGGEGLQHLIERRVTGDAAFVFEGGQNQAVVVGKGQSVWNLCLTRDGDACHELRRDASSDELVDTMLSLMQALRQTNRELAAQKHNYPQLGPESIFVGQAHYGDFFNRAPKTCRLQGTWRWHPNRSFAWACDRLAGLVASLTIPEHVTVDSEWRFVGEAFSVDPAEPIVRCLRTAYQELTGAQMPIAGTSMVTDTNRLVAQGKVPAISVGFDEATAHADQESVRIGILQRSSKIALRAILGYLNQDEC